MAFKEISEGLIRNENGAWATKDGKTVSDAVKAFAEDESNSFLFRPKENNGGGTPPPSGSPKESPKSVFESSQEDVLAAAAERLGGS